MRPGLTAEMAHVVVEDRIEAAERFRRRKEANASQSAESEAFESVTVRLAGEGDGQALRRLAERDGRAAPRAPVLVAEVGGALLAARSLEDGRSVADPFRQTSHLAELLALRSTHLRNAELDGAVTRRPLRSIGQRLKGRIAGSP